MNAIIEKIVSVSFAFLMLLLMTGLNLELESIPAAHGLLFITVPMFLFMCVAFLFTLIENLE